MKYSRWIKMIWMIIAVILLVDCQKDKKETKEEESAQRVTMTNLNMEKYETKWGFCYSLPNKTIQELCTTIYTEKELSDIANTRDSIAQLHQKYPIECSRLFYAELSTSAGWELIRIAYLGENRVLFLNYTTYSGERVSEHLCYLNCRREQLKELRMGQSIESVKQLDKGGDYSGAQGDEKTCKSYHCTLDGYLITIEYQKIEDKYYIISMETALV